MIDTQLPLTAANTCLHSADGANVRLTTNIRHTIQQRKKKARRVGDAAVSQHSVVHHGGQQGESAAGLQEETARTQRS